MLQTFDYYIPTRILFGAGKLADLAKTELPGSKALIVITSGKSMRANGYLDKVRELLKRNHCDSVVFDRILPNPIKAHVMEGAALAKREKCDFILGLGGGSAIDSAKAIAVMATNPGDYWDYIAGGTGRALPFKCDPLPVVAITTTAGTGTEADQWSVITHEERREKIGFGCAKTFPVLSVVDPELMLTIPPHLTAFQGFDAFFHAAEGYLANVATPISDAFALKSIALLARSLPTAVNDGANLAARSDVATASTLSGMVEATSCCISEHSIAHAMGAFHPNLPHGAALISISDAYFRFFADKAPERFCDIARAMGKKGDSPNELVEALAELRRVCHVDAIKLSEYDLTRDELPAIADNAFDTMGGLFQLDPVALTRADVIRILEDSWR